VFETPLIICELSFAYDRQLDATSWSEKLQAKRDTGKRTSYPVGSLVLQDYPPSNKGRKLNQQVLLRKGPLKLYVMMLRPKI